jgi:hypothetical protein
VQRLAQLLDLPAEALGEQLEDIVEAINCVIFYVVRKWCVYLHLYLSGVCASIYLWAQDHRPLAQAVHMQGHNSCWEAWRRTWLSTQSKADSRLRHPGACLGLALRRFGAWNGMTTSGVEQSFSKQCMVFRPDRKNLGVATEHDESVLILDKFKDPKVRRDLLKGAQQVWSQCNYGIPQNVTKLRIDMGARRVHAAKKGTEAGWRRLTQSKLITAFGARKMQSPDELLKRVRIPVADWSSEHEAERLFQEGKLKRRKCEVGMDGGLLANEQHDVQLHHFARAKDATKHTQDLADARKDAVDIMNPRRICPRPQLLARLAGAVAAVERNLANAPAVTACAVQDYGMTVEQVCLRATVCIVADPARLPVRMQWVMALRGGVAVQPRFLTSNGRRGAAVAYHPAIATPRQLWLSPTFAEKFPHVVAVIQSAFVHQTSNWRLIATRSVYNVARAKAKGRLSCLAVIAREEKTGGPSEVTGSQLLTLCMKVDARLSALD